MCMYKYILYMIYDICRSLNKEIPKKSTKKGKFPRAMELCRQFFVTWGLSPDSPGEKSPEVVNPPNLRTRAAFNIFGSPENES